MRAKLNYISYIFATMWILLWGSTGGAMAQEFNPTPPPEPGQLSLLLSSQPSFGADLEQSNPNGLYMIGDVVTVRAYPNNDYQFEAWISEDGTILSTNSEYRFKMERNRRLTAKLIFNPVNNPAEPGGGYYNLITTLKPSSAGSVSQSGQGIYKNGVSVTVTANPYPDYKFLYWQSKGEIVSRDAQYSFAMPSKHHYLEAVFDWYPEDPTEPSAGYRLYLSSSDPIAGYASQSGNGVYNLGDEVTIVASPYMGYSFVGWYENGICLSTRIKHTITINSRKRYIEARFRKNAPEEETPVVEIVPGADPDVPSVDRPHGTVEVVGLPIPGQQVEITAMPEEGYAFEGWYVNGEFIPEAEMDHKLLIEEGMEKVEAKFKKLPVAIETEGGEENWATVTRYKDGVITLKAQEVEGHTFMGWYMLDRLLSKALHYDFDVNILRSNLPVIRAVYAEGVVANEIVLTDDDPLQVIPHDGMLLLRAKRAIGRVMICGFDGRPLHIYGAMEAGEVREFTNPGKPYIITIVDATGTRCAMKLSF